MRNKESQTQRWPWELAQSFSSNRLATLICKLHGTDPSEQLLKTKGYCLASFPLSTAAPESTSYHHLLPVCISGLVCANTQPQWIFSAQNQSFKMHSRVVLQILIYISPINLLYEISFLLKPYLLSLDNRNRKQQAK